MLNHRRTVVYVFVFLFSIVFGACTSQATAQPFTQTPELTKQPTAEIDTPTNIPATIVPSSTYTSTAKPTGTPTSLPTPSDTPTVNIPTNTPTVNAQTMLTEQAIALEQTQIASFSPTCDDINTYYTSISPKENWLAVSCGYKRDQTLQVYSKTGMKWELQFKDFVTEEFIQDGQTPMGALYPVHWSNDEKYLYFRSTIGVSGGGICFYDGLGQGLYSLDIKSGNVTYVLIHLNGTAQYTFSFSPSGQWLAYFSSYVNAATIFNLQTYEEINFQNEKNEVGDFAWSPDGSKLAYSTCQPSVDYYSMKKSSIRIFSLKTRQSKLVLETESGFLRIDSSEGNRLKIYDEYTDHPVYSYFDWSTEQVITPTVTPTP